MINSERQCIIKVVFDQYQVSRKQLNAVKYQLVNMMKALSKDFENVKQIVDKISENQQVCLIQLKYLYELNITVQTKEINLFGINNIIKLNDELISIKSQFRRVCQSFKLFKNAIVEIENWQDKYYPYLIILKKSEFKTIMIRNVQIHNFLHCLQFSFIVYSFPLLSIKQKQSQIKIIFIQMTKISNQSLTQLQLVSKYKKIRQFQEILLTMLNQTNQNMDEQTSTTTKRKCSTCHLTSLFMSNSQIGQDPSTETFMVQIDDNSAYCLNCIEEIIREEMNQVRNLEERFIYFKEFQSSFQEREMIRHRMESATNPEKLNQVQIIQELQSEESALSKEINKFKEDSNQLKQKIYALEVEEEKFWEGINKIERRTNKVQEKSLNTKFDKNYQKDLLDDLSKNSIIHIFLDIKVDDNLALIQGMAMGKRGQNIDIAWDEITVGLGHLLITFNLLMLKYSYDCKIIQQIKIRGTQSQIWVKGKKKVFGIAYNKDNQKPFGQLMQILLYQTYYISQHILQTQNIQYSQQFKLPFLINTHDHKIGDIFIDPFRIEQRLRWNSWTKAMRYFLIDFKHIITVYAINDKYL